MLKLIKTTLFIWGALFKTGLLFSQTVAINEVVAVNQSVIYDKDSSFSDYIELYNYGTASVDLSGFGLSDDFTRPFKWVFSNTSIGPGAYLLVWASDKNQNNGSAQLHTNYRISSSGEAIILTSPNQHRVDSAPATPLSADAALVRIPDGVGAWQVSSKGSPENSNYLITQLSAPSFSHQSGLYQDSFRLTLSHPSLNAIIVYTLDGSEPNINNVSGTTYSFKNHYKKTSDDSVGTLLYQSYKSNLYNSPIPIFDRTGMPDKLTKINTRQHNLYVPEKPVRKAMVIKAKAYIGTTSSKTISKTFFVWPNGNPYQIPVLSLQIQEDYLFDYNKGIYTAGVDYDTWRASNPENTQWSRPEWCNYWRSGSAWEYPAHVEVFDPVNFTPVLAKEAGFRIHGNNSRTLLIKNFRLYARGDGDFELDVFKEKLFEAANPNNKKFKRLLVRGDGTGGPVLYDVVFNRVMQPFFSGHCRIKPVAHFINGEYWGITALRDRMDEHHFEYNYNIPANQIVSVDCMANNCNIDAGEDKDYQEYIAMRDYILNNDMANDLVFSKVDSMLDLNSYIDHMALELFASNDSYERTFWKTKTKLNQRYADGKWRLTIQDFEASLRDYQNLLTFYTNKNNLPNEALFGHMLDNQTFKRNFINRLADLLNTGYHVKRAKAIVDSSYAEVSPYLEEDQNRTPRVDFYHPAEPQYLYAWFETWPERLRDSMVRHFGLSGTSLLQLDVNDTSAGYIKVNSVNINGETPGVSSSPYPWSGVYFNSVPFWLKAIPKPGFVFSHWSGFGFGTADSALITLAGNQLWVANFVKDTSHQQTLYYWLFNTNLPNDSPLQYLSSTYQKGTQMAEIAFNSCLIGYPFDAQHVNWRKAALERKNAPTSLNYRSSLNQFIPFNNANMRGIQIKQPMQSGALENNLVLNCNVAKYRNIKMMFAIASDGAASKVLIEYWNGVTWDTTALPQATFAIDSAYQLIPVNFSAVGHAIDNPTFKVRIRFLGTNMTADAGKAVFFNNISIEGDTILSSGTKPIIQESSNFLRYFPNPAANKLNIWSDKPIAQVMVYNLYGQLVKLENFNQMQIQVDMDELSKGVYYVKVVWQNQSQTVKIIKN